MIAEILNYLFFYSSIGDVYAVYPFSSKLNTENITIVLNTYAASLFTNIPLLLQNMFGMITEQGKHFCICLYEID